MSDLRFCAECACGYEWQPGWGALCGGCRRAELPPSRRDVPRSQRLPADADTIREYVEASGYEVVDAPDGHPVITPRAIAPILAALAALEAELAEAKAALSDYATVSGEQYDYDTLLLKYGEKSRDLREYQQYARDSRGRAEAAEAERDEAQARLSSIGGYEGYDDALERLRKQRNQLLIGSLETTVALLDAEVIFPADFSPELRRRLVRAMKGDTE